MKTKNLTMSVLVGVLSLALWWTMLLKPTRAKASKVKAETAIEQSKLAPLQAQLNQARADAAHAAEFKAQLQSLQLAMPNSPALATFIRDANAIADQSGVAWQSVTHAPPTPSNDGSSSIAVGIQIKGTYPQVIDYLTRLAALQRLVVVDNLALSTAGTTGAQTGGGTSGGSTGPFSGASELTATISARMFESAGAALAAVPTGVSSTAAPSSPAPASKPSTLNNS